MLRKLRKALRLLRVASYRRPLVRGTAATIELDGVPLPDDIRHVIDVGANRGQFLVWAAHQFPNAEFDCFEPFSESVARLNRVRPAGRTVRVHAVALADRNGPSSFHLTRDDDSSSLLRPTELQSSIFRGATESAVIDVEVRTLDSMEITPKRPAFLKLDIQGGELDALRGASRLLEEVDFVLAECSFVELYEGQGLAPEIRAHLEAAGFEFRGFYSVTTDASRSGRLLQADAYFVRSPNSKGEPGA